MESKGIILMHYAPVRHFYKMNYLVINLINVRLACVKHVTSVHTEPGSNPLQQINFNQLKFKHQKPNISFKENKMFHNSFKQI